MIGIQENDICFSTARGGDNPFNTDGVPRTELSPELARTALDFHIVKMPNYDDMGRKIPGQFHLERATEGRDIIPTASIGEKFTAVQHIDVFDYIVNEVMPKVPEMELEMAGTIRGGGVGLVAAKFGDTFAIPGDESENEIRLFFNNPCNGEGRMTLGFTTVRVVCQNTLLAATKEAKVTGWKVTHTKSAPEVTAQAVQSIEQQAKAALEIKRQAKALAEIGVGTETIERCLEAVYPVENLPDGFAKTRLLNLRNAVLEQFEGGETAKSMTRDSAWKLFNSFTYPIFNPEKLRKNQDMAEIAYQGMTGSVAAKVRRIFETVKSIAA